MFLMTLLTRTRVRDVYTQLAPVTDTHLNIFQMLYDE